MPCTSLVHCLALSIHCLSSFHFTAISIFITRRIAIFSYAETVNLETVTQATTTNAFTTSNLWILVAATLVFVMHLGFSALEAGFVRRKNVINILYKNMMIISFGLLTYWFVGFNLMYPGEAAAGSFFGFSGFLFQAGEISADATMAPYTDFIFQAMFAATCCTIVSGAVAERIKLGSFLLFCIFFKYLQNSKLTFCINNMQITFQILSFYCIYSYLFICRISF